VTTSLPLLNRSSVQLGFASRIVIAANLRRSYDDPGSTSLIACRSIGIRELSICAVDTMLWITGIGVPSSSGVPSRSDSPGAGGGRGAAVVDADPDAHGSSAGTSAV
jgi:hypothetical protein